MGRGRSGKGIASVLAEQIRKEKAVRKRAKRLRRRAARSGQRGQR